MYRLILILCCAFLAINCQKTVQDLPANVITTDIENFWLAYDKIIATTDTNLQQQYLQEDFLDKGTPGLAAIREARRYTPQEYLDAITSYPLFWQSIRPNMQKVEQKSKTIADGIEQLRQIYPDLKPAKLYFTLGAFRTGGTTLDSLVLIGSEISMADEHTITSEFPETMSHLPAHFATNPVNGLVFLNVHEYVHTQQLNTYDVNLLAQSLREGTAEFVAVQALGQASPNTCIQYGIANAEAVRDQFAQELFNQYYSYWLWTNQENRFGVRDLGYYPGYAIAERYYEATNDKKQALKDLIELDYTNSAALESLVDQAQYFDQSLAELREAYEASRPQVLGIKEFENGSEDLSAGKQLITIEFSEPMDIAYRGFEFGPLGKKNVIRMHRFIGFAVDSLSISFEADLDANKQQQIVLPGRYRNTNGVEINPYLIDVKTTEE